MKPCRQDKTPCARIHFLRSVKPFTANFRSDCEDGSAAFKRYEWQHSTLARAGESALTSSDIFYPLTRARAALSEWTHSMDEQERQFLIEQVRDALKQNPRPADLARLVGQFLKLHEPTYAHEDELTLSIDRDQWLELIRRRLLFATIHGNISQSLTAINQTARYFPQLLPPQCDPHHETAGDTQ